MLSGIVFYFVNSSILSPAQTWELQLGKSKYQAIRLSDSIQQPAIWPDPVEQAPGVLYDVFTPPVIYVDTNGTFTFESPVDDLLSKPFDIYLVRIERGLYRIQLEGYIEADLNDASKSLLLFYDREKNQQVRARMNDVVAGSGFTVLDFTVECIRDVNGNIEKSPVVTLLDHRDAQKRRLNHGEHFYNQNATVILHSKEDPTFKVEITEQPPIAFRTSLAEYVLEKINLEESSVTVRRLVGDRIDSKTKKLELISKNEPIQLPGREFEIDVRPQVFEFQF